MHDLRQKVLLQSGKTMSRKARSHAESSRTSSVNHTPNTSPGGSRVNSRPGSHYSSEDDDGSASDRDDVMSASVHSGSDDGRDDHTAGKHVEAWPHRLSGRIADLLDRKRSSVQGREGTLEAYVHLLRYHFAKYEISPHMSEIMQALLKSIRGGNSAKEKTLGLQALYVTLLTSGSQVTYDQVYQTLRGVCKDTEDERVKVEAIWALSTAASFGGGSSAAYEEVCQFFMEIIESDGASVGADDSEPVVLAALQAWAFSVTYLPSLYDQAEEAMDAFMEQLDSTEPKVQTSAATNIALLFEAIHQYEERSEEEERGEATVNVQYNEHRILTRLKGIQRDSSKSIKRKDRQHLRLNLTGVITSLEKRTGPGYSTAVHQNENPNKGSGGIRGGAQSTDRISQEFGYREKVRINDQVMTIDSWLVQVRVDALRILLRGGLSEHLLHNSSVQTVLEDAEVDDVPTSVSRKTRRARGDEETFSRKPPKGHLAELSD